MPSRRRVVLPGVLGLVLAFGAGAAGTHAATDPARGVIRGRVSLAVEGAELRDAGPVVVYLEPLGNQPLPPRPARNPSIRQKDARFSPGFLALARGQAVDMANDDAIYHNVFSYSKPNDFDLGLYPAGDSRTVTLRHAGVVRTYCSIHESMSGTIFVAPNAWFDVVRASGSFEIRDVPPGPFRLHVWCERLPAFVRDVRVESGRTLDLDLAIGVSTP